MMVDTQESSYGALMHSMGLRPHSKVRRQKRRRSEEVEHTQDTSTSTDRISGTEDTDGHELPRDASAAIVDTDATQLDPFKSHFESLDEETFNAACQAVVQNKWRTIKTANLKYRTTKTLPDITGELLHTRDEWSDIRHWPLKERLVRLSLSRLLSNNLAISGIEELLQPMASYQDLCFEACNHTLLRRIRSAYSLHVLNHIYKTRDRILKNNEKVASNPGADTEYRDQGYTRPKVLLLLPTRNACLEVVNSLIGLSGLEQVENRKRFTEEYGTQGSDPVTNANKPDDFKAFFSGNTDDAFRLGLKFTRQSLKLFSPFYSSDLILASPLGLRMVIGDKGKKAADHDFLSSIEIIIIDGADAMKMQNWEHVQHCLDFVNLVPKEAHGCDYSRVRSWILDARGRHLTQLMCFSNHDFPELKALFNGLQNVAGKVRIRSPCVGTISTTGISVRQIFQRYVSDDPRQDPDARFQSFTSAMLPRIQKLLQLEAGAGCLLFVSTYFDYVRVRNYLTSLELTFEAISEYSTTAELTRCRQMFASGRSSLLLMTERLHYFRRLEIRGTKNVFFYQLPEYAKFYSELVRGLAGVGQDSSTGAVRAIYTKWDEGRVERIVGSKRLPKMMTSRDTTIEFL